MDRKIDFESAEAGSPLDGISIPALNRVTLARFAAALDDYTAVHLDDKVAKASGKASVYAPSTLVMAYLGRLIEHGLEGCSIRRYDLRVTKILWPGDVLTCRGSVVEARKQNGEYLVDLDVWADNQRGETVASGVVHVVVPKNRESELTKASAGKGLVYRLAVDPTKQASKTKKKKKKAARKKTR